MSDRAERIAFGTFKQLARAGLVPCDECLQEVKRLDPTSISAGGVYLIRIGEAYPLGSRACKSCGCSVLPSGAFKASADFMWKVFGCKAEEESGRVDTSPDDGSCIPKRGGPIMRHGNSKTEFGTGAHRDTDEGKGSPSFISPVLIHRLGVLLQKGAEHYGADNWVKGMPYRRTTDSMIRHIYLWLAGDEEEDHLAAICFGAMCLMTYEARNDSQAIPGIDILDDRDRDLKRILPSILTLASPDAKLETVAENCPIRRCTQCGLNTIQPSGVCFNCSVDEYKKQVSPSLCKGNCGGFTNSLSEYCKVCTMNEKNPGMGAC